MLPKKRKEEKVRVEIGVEKEEGPKRRGELIIYTPEVKSQQQVCTLPFDRATAVPAFLPNVVLRLIEAILVLSRPRVVESPSEFHYLGHIVILTLFVFTSCRRKFS